MITCPAAPSIDHGTIDTNLALYGTTVTYTCNYGYHFPSGNTTDQIVCQDTGSWSTTPDHCQGKKSTNVLTRNNVRLINYICYMSYFFWHTFNDRADVDRVDCVISLKSLSTRMGFEPTRAEPNGLAVHRLNHSATSSSVASASVCIYTRSGPHEIDIAHFLLC